MRVEEVDGRYPDVLVAVDAVGAQEAPLLPVPHAGGETETHSE